MTPLQMAMVAATIANDGVADAAGTSSSRSSAPDGKTVAKLKPDELGRRSSRDDRARPHGDDARRSSRAAPATARRSPASSVAGKTGTAETGRTGVNTRLVRLLRAGRATRSVAVAVFVEAQQQHRRQTAAPIAKEVMQAILGAG